VTWSQVSSYRSRRTKGGVIEGCQILFHSSARRPRAAVLVPIFAGDRALLVGVRDDQAGIDRNALATHQVGSNARLYDALEHAAEDVAVAELLAGARECRVVLRR
jgi:hypothetical protein